MQQSNVGIVGLTGEKHQVSMTDRSIEAQKLREAQLRGKQIVFVSCGSDSTKDAIYKHASEGLGINVFIIESEHNQLAKTLSQQEKNITHIKCDLSMRPTILDECIDAITNTFGDQTPDAVLTFWDDAVGLCARIATHFGVLTNSVEAIDISHDKFLARLRLSERGLPSPQFVRVHSYEEMKHAAATMSYPAILKPTQGAASIGVSLVQSPKEALETYKRTVTLMEAAVAEGDLMGLVFDEHHNHFNTFVLEEFIDGEEVDVDMCLYRGQPVYSNINGDWPIEDGVFCELGISFPAKSNETERGREFRDAALRCCQAIGVTDGVVHVEMKYSSKYGPVLVELNPRMGGGPLYQFHKRCFDVDLVTEHILVMSGFPSNPPALQTHRAVCSCLFIYAPTSGVCGADMHTSAVAEKLRSRPHVTSVKYTAMKGDVLSGWDNRGKFPTGVGRLDIAVDRDEMEYDDVIEYCKDLRRDALEIIYE